MRSSEALRLVFSTFTPEYRAQDVVYDRFLRVIRISPYSQTTLSRRRFIAEGRRHPAFVIRRNASIRLLSCHPLVFSLMVKEWSR
ncbi:hypothetical protein QQF64_017138 [Cirrhinus molitorella]|uniref:Uncharacterized protein n=1 Tax=Cirrhinus molitorella TaxID=172907 RepID=A0ABR3LJE9_9TELE